MKHWLVYTISSLLLFSCGKKHDDGAISMSLEKRDSLLLEHIIQEFDYNWDPGLYELSKRRFSGQLKRLRQDTTPTGFQCETHEAKFKSYHLKSFLFDSQQKPPFVVEVTNNENQFISLFSFTDEKYYSRNSITIKKDADNSEKLDSILRKKINLEQNLNELAKRLNINQNKIDMLAMVSMLCNLLEMHKTSEDSVKNFIEVIHSNGRINDSIYKLVIEEQSIFFRKVSGEVLTVLTQSGFGYWRFWIEKNEDRLIIRTAFFSDILYTPMYM